ncbi:MAG: DUF4404 family protein [Pseudomonadales bacterium]
MSNRDIRTTLEQLHGELEKTPALDADLRTLLEEVDADIHALLAAEGDDDGALKGIQEGIQERVESLAADFAARHPNTEVFFRELVAALGRMGI